uniref:Uncharacterized protein n=1 Tax=Heliothis virescens TaxID=7102 RepID=A0A2A4JKG8_HELVI
MRENNEALSITPEQIRHSFADVMTDEYINLLAKNFATKAAAHFVKEMSNQKVALDSQLRQRLRSPLKGAVMKNIQNELTTLQNAQPAAQTLSQAQEEAKAAEIEGQVEAQVKKQAKEKVKEKTKAATQLQTEVEEKGEEVEEHPSKPTENQNTNNEMLDSDEALHLLREPEPDGDHLDSQSGELSKEAARERIPVIQVMKINGAYYRRLLGLI